jgi:hypothetical protein
VRSLEAFLIGLILGAILMTALKAANGDTKPAPVVASDTSGPCCEEYLDHIAREHR